MPTQLDADRATLPPLEAWPASDSRRLEFTVVVDNDDPKDISDDDVFWYLLENPYDDSDDALYDGDSSGVEVVTDSRVDTQDGEFEVRVDEGTLDEEWGEYSQRVVVDAPGETRLSWQGRVTLRADGTTA